ncbi:4'-phosphopantetheinyl transferase superfamily protein [Dyella sp. EPa41]|uniref:4'-phosphopantetheinyl transferase family protein n=1 Tax=Dyella sp. EPa41 TaxID=1561194 RepID=UPI001914EA98|nr:4'-phosphopantetheinyl transferase superfamily protein [Dyella sp. EPa41]
MSDPPSLRMLVDDGSWSLGEHEALVVLFDSAHCVACRDEAMDVLSMPERERSHRFRQPQHRDEYVLAHAMWRLVLAEVLDVSPRDVSLASTSHGQPCLPGTGHATSISHSGGKIAVAVARGGCIGVDIEQSPPRMGMQDLLKVVCTAEEAEALRSLPEAMRDDAMLALWTRKEALLKAFGVGLLVAPSSIGADAGVSISPPAIAAGSPACIVRQLALPAGWTGALAAPRAITRVRMQWLPTHIMTGARDASEDRPVM